LGETHPKPHTVAHYAGHYQNYPFPRQGKSVEHTLFAIASNKLTLLPRPISRAPAKP
jgi:hypothetical protein